MHRIGGETILSITVLFFIFVLCFLSESKLQENQPNGSRAESEKLHFEYAWIESKLVRSEEPNNNKATVHGITLNAFENSENSFQMIDCRSNKRTLFKVNWTPSRKSIAIKLKVFDDEFKNERENIELTLISLETEEKDGPLMFENVSILDLLDDVFPGEPYFVASNLSTLLREGLSLRQSLCYHWLMYYQIDHTEREKEACHSIENFCNLISHFVRRKQLFRIPNQCLSCPIVENQIRMADVRRNISRYRFGSRNEINRTDQSEVIYLLDGSCHSHSSPKFSLRLMMQLNRLSKMIAKQFKLQKMIAKFMILTMNSNGRYVPTWPKFESNLMFSHLLTHQFHKAKSINASRSKESLFRESLWSRESKHSLDFLFVFPFSSPGTSRHFIMIDCLEPSETKAIEKRTCRESEIDFTTARNNFLQSNNYLHIITNGALVQHSISSLKMRRIIGFDWQQVMFDSPANNQFTSSNRSRNQSENQIRRRLRDYLVPRRDVCHVLALETNGTIFDHRVLKQSNRKKYTERLAENQKIETCQHCDCVLARDLLVAQQECSLCEARSDTLPNFSRKLLSRESLMHSNESSDSMSISMLENYSFNNYSQDWTENDEDQSLKTIEFEENPMLEMK
ncbi:Pancreatic lipase-related protein 1 [Sarcoptes scabiei]|nr:Pancreatic lipase-related protein 1 [Sarcoptes scabiei]